MPFIGTISSNCTATPKQCFMPNFPLFCPSLKMRLSFGDRRKALIKELSWRQVPVVVLRAVADSDELHSCACMSAAEQAHHVIPDAQQETKLSDWARWMQTAQAGSEQHCKLTPSPIFSIHLSNTISTGTLIHRCTPK